jgi:hypothetical protein
MDLGWRQLGPNLKRFSKMKKYLALYSLTFIFATQFALAANYITGDAVRSPDRAKTWTMPAASGTVVTETGTATLTNKTLTAPAINSPTGIVKGDVGLGNVDNTSDGTKNSASATLTNKTLTDPAVSDAIRLSEQSSAPSTPGAGYKKIYAKTDGKLYTKDSAGAEKEVGSGAGTSSNLLANPSFEDAAYAGSWTVTAGTPSVDTSDYVAGEGVQALSLSLSSVTGTILTQTVTPTPSLVGNNLEYSLFVKTSLQNLQVCAVNGTIEIQCDAVPSANQWGRVSLTIAAPASGAIGVRLKSTSSATGTVKVDGGYTGLARNLTSVWPESSLQSYTPTLTNGTNSSITYAQWSRDKDAIIIMVGINWNGAGSGGQFEVSLPNGLLTKATNTAVVGSGFFYRSGAGGFEPTSVRITSGSTLYFTRHALSSFIQGSDFANTYALFFTARVPIQGWTAETAFRPDKTLDTLGMIFYSLDASCPTGSMKADGAAILRTTKLGAKLVSGGLIYGTGDGSTTVNIPNSQGVFPRGAGSQTFGGETYSGTLGTKQNDNLQSHTHTLSNTSDRGAFGAWSGTGGRAVDGGGGAGYNTSTVTSNAAGSGTETYPANIALTPCIATESAQAPLLTNGVTSNSDGFERVMRAKVLVGSSCAITSQSGTWISSVGSCTTGDATLAIAAGTFPVDPTCTATVYGTGSMSFCMIVSSSTTSIRVACANSPTTLTNLNANIVCMSPR